MKQSTWETLAACLHLSEDWLGNDGWQRPHSLPPHPDANSAAAATIQETAPQLDWQQAILQCKRCPLRSSYQRQPITCLQSGSPELLIVAGPPNADADRLHQPLAPSELDYLGKWLAAIKVEHRYLLTNVSKCLPPGGRNPFANELMACLHHLDRQAQLYPFAAVLALGGIAARALSLSNLPLPELRKQQFSYQSLPLIVTYEPAQVLAHPQKLRPFVWEDLKRLARHLKPKP